MAVGANFERNVAKVEYFLSKGAAIPGLGAIAGAIKVILGTIQMVGALLALIISAPFLFNQKVRNFAFRAGSHFVNGLANIVAGALEAIPIVGSIIFAARYYRKTSGSDFGSRVYTDQEHTLFVGYRILEDNPSNISDLTGTTFEDARNMSFAFFRRTSPLLAV